MRRVLFVCFGNACRSQMAEAFARAYGSDVVTPGSAGLWPASAIPQFTVELMREKGIGMDGHFPKGLYWSVQEWDLVVNMSGMPLPRKLAPALRKWEVEDPIALPPERHREIRDQIEGLVRGLVEELRAGAASLR